MLTSVSAVSCSDARTVGLTGVVTLLIHRVRMQEKLRPGFVVRCPHCRKWHPVVKWHTEGTAYTLRMLYFACRDKRYYAGQQDLDSRHETKAG